MHDQEANMRWLFTPPLFADEEQTQLARQLYVILWTMILAITVTAVMDIFILPEATWRWLLILGSVDATCLVLLGLTRRGQTRLASKLFVLILWVIVTALALTAGGIRAPAINAYLPLVLIAGLLLGARAGIITAMGCSLTGLGLAYATWMGVLPPMSVQNNEFSLWASFTLYLAVIVGLQYLATDAIKKSLRRAQQELAERRQTEAALRVSEEHYRLLAENISDVIWILDLETMRFRYVSPSVERLRGYTAEEVLAADGGESVTPDSLQHIQQVVPGRLREAMQGLLKGYVDEIEQPCKDGSTVWTEVTTHYFLNQDQGHWEAYGVSRDITERKRAEEALRESGEKYRGLVEQSLMGIGLSRGNQVIFANPALLRIFGYDDLEEFAKVPLLDHVDLASRDQIAARLRRVAQGETQRADFEYNILRKDGKTKTLYAVTTHITLGGEIYTQTVIQDITERKWAEKALEESEKRYRELFENASLGIFRSTLDGKVVAVNPAFTRMFGYESPEEVAAQVKDVGTDIFADPRRRAEIIRLKAENPSLTTFENLYRRKDGSTFFGKLTVRQFMESDGRELFEGFVEDITDRKQAEKSLAALALRYQTLLQTASDGIHVIDTQGNVVEVNDAFCKMLGYTRAELLRLNIADWDAQWSPEILWAQARTLVTRPALFETRHRRKDGTIFDVEVNGVSITLDNRIYFYASARDITERKRAEEALRELNAELEQRVEERTKELSLTNLDLVRAVRLKDEFLANMSHELRTPLNAILGLSESLQEGVYGPLNERQMHSVQTIESSGRHLLALITDILDLSKIGVGTLDVQLGPVLVKSVCQASLRFVQQAAHKKHLALTSQLDEQVSVLEADERRLKQILVNLLSNAVKFTPEGGAVGLEVVGDAERGEARFTVWDTGIGIAPEDIERLFLPFVQLDTGLARRYEGAGLGLTLVARLVELHGGHVWVESPSVSPPRAGGTKGGPGSRFTVAIPWQAVGQETRASGHAQADPERADAEPPRPVSPRPAVKILLAEDNPMAFEVVAEYLTEKGYHVIMASNGAEAIERARQEQPALILMDAQMPVMDGLEATRRLRADAELKHIPVIALTGLAMEGDEARCLEAGANDYLTKPVSLKKLMSVIEAQLK